MSSARPPRLVLVWHVHGAWTESFVAGPHRYLVPRNVTGNGEARGLCGRNWPAAQEVSSDQLRHEDVDLVILQRPEDIDMATRWLGRRPGSDVPAIYVEHNAPRPSPVDSVHPMAERSDIPIVHVTDFNRMMWDNGAAPTRVITHGVADPGPLYSGEIATAATMINEPIRRWRTVGADMLAGLAAHVPVDVWGMDTEALGSADGRVRGRGDVAAPQLWEQVGRRRVYLHTARWTSLGLSLIEAMFLGMPVVAVASTMAPLVVPAEAGVVSADLDRLASALRRFAADAPAAVAAGKSARDFAMAHFSLDGFLANWDDVVDEYCS